MKVENKGFKVVFFLIFFLQNLSGLFCRKNRIFNWFFSFLTFIKEFLNTKQQSHNAVFLAFFNTGDIESLLVSEDAQLR